MTSEKKLSAVCSELFKAKQQKNLTFANIAEQMGKNEVWVAALFYGQAKPTHDDINILANVLELESRIKDDFGTHYFPDRGGLMEVPPTDPLIYRLHEMIQVYGYPLKAVIQEKFGDGIVSAIDFTATVEKIEHPNGDRARIILDGKFLPYKAW